MTSVARILVGLVLVASSLLCAWVYDPPAERERVAWLCSATKPRCLAQRDEAVGQ